MTMQSEPDNDAIDIVGLPHYDRSMRLLEKLGAWARAGFPGATFADLARIASNHLPEKRLSAIRKRADSNCAAALGLRPPRR